MIRTLKKQLYFFVASYFRFFAGIYLARWNPKIIVVTGSQGKTTLLHLLESQIGAQAVYSHQANSAFGIPFHILGLSRKTFGLGEWVQFVGLAPLRAFAPKRGEKLYVVEADSDRPGEAEFIARLLLPSVTLWVSASRTHTMNFKTRRGDETIETAVAHEFGWFAEYTGDLVVANGDVPEIVAELPRSHARQITLEIHQYLDSFKVNEHSTEFVIDGEKYTIPYLLPKAAACSLAMTEIVCKELAVTIDPSFSRLKLPPGRSSIFAGVKGTMLIDSSYNASLESMRAMLELFADYPRKVKWIVLGDMLELGKQEVEEHQKLAGDIEELNPDRIVLVGPRLLASTYPALSASLQSKTTCFDSPADALVYLQKEIVGDEAILFKGARFLEGIIEALLYTKEDAKLLPRREEVWQKRRKQWKL